MSCLITCEGNPIRIFEWEQAISVPVYSKELKRNLQGETGGCCLDPPIFHDLWNSAFLSTMDESIYTEQLLSDNWEDYISGILNSNQNFDEFDKSSCNLIDVDPQSTHCRRPDGKFFK